MRVFAKSAMAIGLAGGMALAAMSAANADYYSYGYGAYAYAPGYGAYAYAPGYGAYAYAPGYRARAYAPGYGAYAYAPGYRYDRMGDLYTTQSWPPHHDPGAGYNSNTLSPFKDRKMQAYDY
jgi:hypothetical protein